MMERRRAKAMPSDGNRKPTMGPATAPPDLESYLEDRIARVRRGNLVRAVVWPLIIVLLGAVLIGVPASLLSYVEHPSWIGQLAGDAAAERVPGILDGALERSAGSAPRTFRNLERRALASISQARRNAHREGLGYAKKLSKKVDDRMGEVVAAVLPEDPETAVDLLRGGTGEGGETIDDVAAEGFPGVLREMSARVPRWKSVDIVVAVSSKLQGMGGGDRTSEEELEAEIFVLFARLLEGDL